MFSNTEKTRAGMVFTVSVLANLVFQLVASVVIQALKTDLNTNFTAFLFVQLLLPAAVFGGVFFYVRKRGSCTQKSAWSWRKPRLSDMLIAGGLGVAVCFSSGFLNELFSWLMNAIGIENGLDLPESRNLFELVLFMFVLCVLPAFSEEMVFRGALTSFLTSCKTWATCMISGALFALMHMNLSQMLNAFLVGMLLTLMTLRSGSIFPAMLLHFVNNVTTVVSDLVIGTLQPPVLFLNFTLFQVVAAAVCLIPIGLAVWHYSRMETRCGIEYGALAPLSPGTGRDLGIALAPGILMAVLFTFLNTAL